MYGCHTNSGSVLIPPTASLANGYNPPNESTNSHNERPMEVSLMGNEGAGLPGGGTCWRRKLADEAGNTQGWDTRPVSILKEHRETEP